MIIKHNISTENLSCDRSSRKINELLLLKNNSIYKFASANINSEIVVSGKLNLQILSKRDNELKELPSDELKFYDKVLINNIVIYKRKETILDKIFKLIKGLI